MKTRKKKNVPGTSKVLYSLAGEHLGSVTEYTDGTFLAYLPEVGGPWLPSRLEAEAFIEKQATDAGDEFGAWIDYVAPEAR